MIFEIMKHSPEAGSSHYYKRHEVVQALQEEGRSHRSHYLLYQKHIMCQTTTNKVKVNSNETLTKMACEMNKYNNVNNLKETPLK